MVKHISLVHRPAGTTREAFASYWKDVHAELVKTRLPGLRKYVGNLVIPPASEGARRAAAAISPATRWSNCTSTISGR